MTRHAVLLFLVFGCARQGPSVAPAPQAPSAAPRTPVQSPDSNPVLAGDAPPVEIPSPATHAVLSPTEVAGEASIYELPAKLQDQDGQDIALDVWRGHPTIVALFFATCPQACPLLIGNIQHIERSLQPAERADLRVLLVSLEPVDDTPAVLRKVAKKFGLDTKRWRLARTDVETVRDIAAVLGVAYRRLDDGSFNHSSVITLTDRDGRVVSRQDGILRSTEPLGSAIGKVVASRVAP